MDVETAADELYGLNPDEFVARRAELAGQARTPAQASVRTEIAAMRRPTAAAWAVNLVVREHPDDVVSLFRVADELRSAQRGLHGERLRELSSDRRSAIANLVAAARSATERASGKAVSEQVLRDVQATLEAAVADENAEAAVRSGRLTTALHYSGFGEVDISDAVAAANARPRLAVVRGQPTAPTDAGRSGGRQETRKPPSAARQRAVEEARVQLTEATVRRDQLFAEAEQLRRRLTDLERETRTAEAAVRTAERRLHAREQRST